MGNSLGCSASGERLVSAARDGDLVEAKMLLDLNPSLARYSTFGGLNTPLHLAAAKGHSEIVQLLLKNGASVDSRNYCGQTPLMQACRSGHWEVVQSLVLYRCNVGRADYLTGRTALHFAAMDGHTRCLRLLLSDHTPFSSAQESPPLSQESCDQSEVSTLSRLVNRASDGGITALHMAAVNGQFECVQLLLDFHADVNATTYHYGTTVSLIGSGSTPLHYAACGGNLKCCQILLSRGASRLALNCNGWLPLDVARIWRRHQLEQILAPNSKETVPRFPSSNFLSLPLFSILSIAREFGLQSSASALQNNESCAVCLERTCSVAAEGCKHELCIKCAFYLSSSGSTNTDPLSKPGTIPCPLCRHGISHFLKLPTNPQKHSDPSVSLNFCNPCLQLPPTTSVVAMPAAMTVPCVTFPSISSARMGPCGPKEEEKEEEEQNDLAQVERMERSICSGMFRGRRSFHKEKQCDSEIRS